MSKSKKQTLKDECKELTPVFKLKPLSEKEAMCKYIGNIHNSDKLADDLLEVEGKDGKPTNLIQFGNYGSGIKQYSVYGKACSCNVIADYFVKKTKDGKLEVNNKKIPVYYMTLLYANQLVTGFLVTVFIYFNLDEKSQKELDNPKKIVNKRLSGHYTLELVADEGFLSQLINKMKPELDERFMEKYADKFDDDLTDEQKEDIFKQINNEVENVLNEYRNMFEPRILEKLPTNKSSIRMMQNLIVNNHFDDIVKIALKFRESERRNKMCPDQDYEPPKKIINLKEFKEHPEKLDEYINNLSNTDSSNDDKSNSEESD